MTKVENAVGTAAAADEVRTAYTSNGQVDHVIDAESNRTTYIYDGFDRLSQTRYPSTTKGANSSNASDYEGLTYDARSSVTARRLRDGTSIGYSYDDLGQLTAKDIPGGTNDDIAYAYDLLGRASSATKGGGTPLGFVHDALGRVTSQTQMLGTTSYTYDAAGRRLTMAYPGGVLTVNYDYDVTGQVTKIRENGAVSGVGVLAAYAYDDLGRRTSVTFGNGSVQSFTYGTDQRLATLTNNLGGAATTHDMTQSFTYNPAGQIASVARSNDAYAWQAHYNVDRAYVADGLNRIMSAGGIGFSYDTRGNLTSDGTNSFTYNSENLMTDGPGGTKFKYDALGRLQSSFKTGQPFATRYEYDGADLIVEFDAPSTVLRRYVHGPGIDNPITWYEGSAVSNTTRRFLMADERGSVVSITDSAGATININSFDEYGIPAPGNIGRFGYTGQTWLPEVGMWYYKARLYSPTLGRFMQSDPIGYRDGMNWYNYVGSDPVNFSDPTGLCVLQYRENGENCHDPRGLSIEELLRIAGFGDDIVVNGTRSSAELALQEFGGGDDGLFLPLPTPREQIENCKKLGLDGPIDRAIGRAIGATSETGNEYAFAVGMTANGSIWTSKLVTSNSPKTITQFDRNRALKAILGVRGMSRSGILLIVHTHPTVSSLSSQDNKTMQVLRNQGLLNANVMAVDKNGTRYCTLLE